MTEISRKNDEPPEMPSSGNVSIWKIKDQVLEIKDHQLEFPYLNIIVLSLLFSIARDNEVCCLLEVTCYWK